MSLFVFLIVLAAALLHAGWNVIVRAHADRLVSLTVLQVLMGFVGAGLLVWAGLPNAEASKLAILSGVLHLAYNLFLVRAYKAADLSQVYPIARGSAPLFTLIGAAFILHDVPPLLAVVAILILVAGLILAGLRPRGSVTADPQAVMYALGTAVFIAAYTLLDGYGARVSGNAFAYAGLLFIYDGLFLLFAGMVIRGPGFVAALAREWKMGTLGALASGAAYALVIWAMTQAPIASVAALRETSIIFVLILSARVLQERLTLQRVSGGLLIVAGAVLLRLA